MADVGAVCDLLRAIQDPSDRPAVAAVSAAAGQCLGDAPAVVEAATLMLGEATEEVREGTSPAAEGRRMALWLAMDRLAKDHPPFVDALRPVLADLAVRCGPRPGTPHAGLFEALVKGLQHSFGVPLAGLIALRIAQRNDAERVKEEPGTAAAGGAAPEAGGVVDGASRSRALVAQPGIQSFGGFVAQRGNMERPKEGRHQLMVKTRDSLQAVRVSSMYAPAAPAEIAVAVPERDADAPLGHVVALPAGDAERYRQTRVKRFREMAERRRQQDEERDRQRRREEATGAGTAGDVPVDPFPDVIMPLDMPRDEHGVQRGNYPAGVRFLREAIIECGGALEIERIEARIASLTDEEARAGFGVAREFILIHKPTFTVHEELSRWVVRLTGAEPPDPGATEPPLWKDAKCPLCTARVGRGWNLPRHMNNRRCCGRQLAAGLDNVPSDTAPGPIADLGRATRRVSDLMRSGCCDDSELDAFAAALEAAANVKRFRLASQSAFGIVLNTIREVRNAFLASKGVEDFDVVEITGDDRSVVRFFATLGANMRRLPVAWIETGDVVDMSRRFCTGLLHPHPPPPRPGFPAIRPGNAYPGMLFADSDTDHEDEPSADEGFSDEEAEQFEFAPPVSPLETMMVAGIERDTKRLNCRLKTAPPMRAAKAIRGDGTKTHAEMYASRHT